MRASRRKLIATAAATFAAAVVKPVRAQMGVDTGGFALPEKVRAKHFARFIDLDAESRLDFVGGIKNMQHEYTVEAMLPSAHPEQVAYLRARGLDPEVETDLSFEAAFDIMMQCPQYAAFVRVSRSAQGLMWSRARAAIYAHEDLYLSAMEATDKSGPGSLELNPSLRIPEYATYEIHNQPGGYVGDQFAGMLYHYALAKAFYQGMFTGPAGYDEPHYLVARASPTPEDGRVRRILELGCSDGRTTIAMKERFPDAEVWGLDVGAPMVRYAHHRAAAMGLDVRFVNRLAEDTGFPDGHFDLIVTNLLFHEVMASSTRRIVPEIHRIMRKGAVWHLVDGGSGHPNLKPAKWTIQHKAAFWANHRFNTETWAKQWLDVDMYRLLQETGFSLDPKRPQWVPIKV